jgi:HAMP domain-containing protein
VTLFAVFSLARGYGDYNDSMALPGTMLVLLVLNFVALWRTRPRNPLRRIQHEVAAKLY